MTAVAILNVEAMVQIREDFFTEGFQRLSEPLREYEKASRLACGLEMLHCECANPSSACARKGPRHVLANRAESAPEIGIP
jgi:hypothetical protein